MDRFSDRRLQVNVSKKPLHLAYTPTTRTYHVSPSCRNLEFAIPPYTAAESADMSLGSEQMLEALNTGEARSRASHLALSTQRCGHPQP
ncbi:hypothetical protein IRJ41_005062 [Triplophysa rosa]|uniref:Uncharacterized protein n=1 Tax=Triplophysa rosa TaxID=992332 RepID=A0A9W7WSK1_TRIRA|nr:hypothetical protein IRJ41_005062 [Triplophysa rosa]